MCSEDANPPQTVFSQLHGDLHDTTINFKWKFSKFNVLFFALSPEHEAGRLNNSSFCIFNLASPILPALILFLLVTDTSPPIALLSCFSHSCQFTLSFVCRFRGDDETEKGAKTTSGKSSG